MKVDPNEARAGQRWFVIAGMVAILFGLFLKNADDRMTVSRSEKELGATLRELRTAQTSLPATAQDPRQTLHLVMVGQGDAAPGGH